MVERKHVFDSTYDTLKALPPRHFAQYFFKINFSGESGIDGGHKTFFPHILNSFFRGSSKRMDYFIGKRNI